MSRKSFLNILENVFQPTVNEAMKIDLLGKTAKVTTLVAETTLIVAFGDNSNQQVVTGSANLTSLACTYDGLKEGEEVLLKITQGAAARTIAWGTGFAFAGGTGPTVTAGAAAVDLFKGVFTGGVIVLEVVAQNIS